MKNTNIRIERLNKLIQKKINNLIKEEVIITELITVTLVKTFVDLSEVHVYVLISDDIDRILKMLNRKSLKMQHILSSFTKLRKFPKIRFLYDIHTKNAIDVVNLIEKFNL